MFRRAPHVSLVILLLLTGPALRRTAAQSPPDLQAWLSRPVSPGTIAYLVNFPQSDPLVGRLAGALRDARSNVRAAAARVAFVLGAGGLAPLAAEALKTESDVGAAVEEARLVAYFSSADPVLLDAWTRLGADAGADVLLTLAGARGVSSLRVLPQVRAAGASDATIAAFIRLATRGERGATMALASEALDQRDNALFAAVLASTRDIRGGAPDYSDDLALKGLAPGISREAAVTAIGQVLHTWNPVRPLSEQLKRGLEQTLDAGHVPGNATELLALELAARAVGRAPGATPGWNDLVATPPRAIRPLLSAQAVRALLDERELDTMRNAWKLDSNALRPPNRQELQSLASRSAVDPAVPTMRTASGYPIGFMTDVLRVTQCNVADANKAGYGEAALTFRPDGRALRVGLVDSKAPRACADALRVLMVTHVESVNRIPPEQARVLLPFDAEFIACQDAPVRQPPLAEDARVEGPRKTRHVPPVYLQSAIDQRVQGIVIIESVIASTGCVAGAQVTRPVDPRLDGAALLAVTRWRFSPTLVDGAAVPVMMTVTVMFSLN